MPLSCGIPLGLIVALVGAFLLVFTRRKPVAWATIIAGLAITLGTAALIILALNSGM